MYVDFASLQAINSDVRVWLRFDDLDTIPIDYPVLYNGDNYVYIHTDVYGDYSFAGCIFIEETNMADFEDEKDFSKIIYGHNMKNGTMFEGLRKYQLQGFVESSPYFSICTPEETYRYRIFSCFITTTGSFVYQTGFTKDTESYQAYIDQLKESSAEDTGIFPSSGQAVAVLSTCAESDSDRRLVVCGVRIGYGDERYAAA